uniref:cysteine-rich and transmembrane domain-containing protein A n=1 Tax=Fragaria vesca subsp. vesca TaxID=101020 RepID=UPI0005CA59D3|nr:PREDICTED: cysteine-rich and transmembrane domain-containing protein A [Fragaria vesca subsp. vesca]
MAKTTETQDNQPPPGYPTATNDPPTRKKFRPQTKKKGDRGFIEGCLFALCCCWLCEECF